MNSTRMATRNILFQQIYDQMDMFDWPRQFDAIYGEGAAAKAKAEQLNASQSQESMEMD